ncbi:MAG: fibronectin type III-like domain-contianing protein, partial [Paraglaciecola polaris]|uniref:fibronectin type III-like domain-contianing protein n=1 Tax=Paraglaciecola polaris TaxID=222814 RepID=UPI003001846B
LYPFGFGRSYTEFSFNDLTVSQGKPIEGEALTLSVEVENRGDIAGETVVQAYLSPIARMNNEAISSLKSFKRIHLAPKETRWVELTIQGKDLYQVNNAGETVWPQGRYSLAVGDSLPSPRSLELGAAPHQRLEIKF